MGKETILKIEQLTKSYQTAAGLLTVVADISLELAVGQTYSLVGPSGSGKSTLLGLCAGLDRPTSGSVQLAGSRLDLLDEDACARLRSKSVGFVFQNFQLIYSLTALENVMVPLELQRISNARELALELLEQVGLADRAGHYPVELSGGEQQRVAIARAYSNHPQILFADEPTGNLDSETGQVIQQLLFKLNSEQDTTLLIATHDLELAARTDKIFRIKGGKLSG